MKNYAEMNPLELAVLDDDAIENLVQLECMAKGIEYVTDIPDRPVTPPISGDIPAYEVGGIRFMHEGSAQEVADLINSSTTGTMTYHGDYSSTAMTGIEWNSPQVQVKTVAHFSETERHRRTPKRQAHLEAVARWETEREEVKKHIAKVDEIRDRITDLIDKARSAISRAKAIQDTYQQYLALSDGNEETALKFLHALGRYTTAEIEGALEGCQYEMNT